MKKFILPLALLASMQVFAQNNSQDNISGEQARPASVSLKPVAEALLTRIHTIGIEERVSMMRQNGQTSQNRVMAINLAGAVVYDHEIAKTGDDEYGFFDDDSIAGRNAGFQVLPYNISLTTDNRIFVSASALGFKNMISNLQDDELEYAGYSKEESVWNVLDNIEILKVEYNKNYLYNNMEDLHVKVVQLDAKLNLIKELPDNQSINLKAGTAPLGYHKTTVTMLTNDRVTLEGFESSIRYGLEYNLNTKNGWRFNAEVMASHQWSFADNQSNLVMNGKSLEKGFNPYNTSNEHSAMIDRDKPMISYFYVAPKIEISKAIGNPDKSPKRLGIRLNANLPVNHRIQGAGNNIDLKMNQNPSMYNAGIFFNF